MTSNNQYRVAVIQILLVIFHNVNAIPFGMNGSNNDIDDQSVSGNGRAPVDYHTVVGHFKDFFMYLPVMMTTLKETMSGFPKFAEGVRILTSGKGRTDSTDDCKCNKNNNLSSSSNELENNSRYG